MPVRDLRRCWWLCLVGGLTLAVAGVRAQSNVSLLSTTTPGAAQPAGQTLTVGGTGFPSGTILANAITVTLEPKVAGAGVTATTTATAITAPAGPTRRVSFQIPATISVPVATPYLVSIAGTTATGAAFRSANKAALTVNPSSVLESITPATAVQGETIGVVINAAFTDFLQGTTRAVFGDGISVNGSPEGAAGLVTVTSKTTATATIAVSASAAAGPRAVLVSTGAQQASLAQGFSVTVPVPVNHDPVAGAGGPYSGTAGVAIAFVGTGSDPDDDPITFAWTFSDGGSAAGASVTHAFAVAGNYTATLTVSDNRGGSRAASAAVTVVAANLAPVVTIPPVGAVTLPATASITATVVDTDHKPNPTPALTWSQVSGPGTATFTPADAAATTVSFTAAGTYALRLSANDGALTGTADVTVTVEAANLAPVVTIPPVGAVTLPATASITATVVDTDHKPNATPALTWSQVSGPGTATFAPADAAATTVSFTAAGTYTLRLSADDGALTGTADVTVTVVAKNDPPVVGASGDASVVLPSAATLRGTATDDGERQPLTYQWVKVDGAGAVVFSAPTMLDTTATFGAAGTYTLRFTASDGELSRSADVTVVASAPTSDNQPPRVNAGGDQTITLPATALLSGTATDDGKPSGSTLDVTWSKWSGPGGVTFADPKSSSTSAAFTAPGVYVLHLSASDGTLTATDDVVVTVIAGANTDDRSPPVVTLTAAATALPGAQVDVRAKAADNDRVSAIRIEIEGQSPVEAQGGAVFATASVPAIASPGQTIAIAAIARDPAGNEGRASGRITVTAIPDTTAPEVQLRGPSSAGPGQSVRLLALATDAGGIASVTFLVGGNQVGQAGDAPFVATYTVPTDAVVGTTVDAVARAVDTAGNQAESTLSIPIVAAADVTPPAVALTTTGSPLPGAAIALSAAASDASGIATVAFAVDGVVIATLTASPYEVAYTIPASIAAGTTLQVSAIATDFSGLTSTDVAPLLVAAPVEAPRALVLGEVYDDYTGLPLAGVTARLTGPAAGGSSVSATTDARGQYSLAGVPGDGIVRLVKEGWTTADRSVTLIASQGVDAFDARLTPLGAAASVSAVLGGTALDSRAALAVPAGALAQATSLSVTPVGQQGLQGLLPYGWSPVGAADVSPHAVSFLTLATLTVANGFSLPGGTAVTVARWDEVAFAWRKVADAAVRQDGQSLEAGVISGGQYAWLLPDSPPATPIAEGDAIPGVAPAALPDDAVTAITPQPKVAFYKPGVRSDVRGQVTTAGPLTSGVRVWQRLVESYRYYSGAEVHPQPFVQDLVLFRAPGVPTTAAARSIVTPSLTFEPLSLERGVIGVELYVPSEGAAAVVVGPTGSTVLGPSGEALMVPPGAVVDATAVRLATLTSADLGLPLPAGLTFAGGVQVTFAGELMVGGVLSVAKPAGAGSSDQFLVVRLAEIGGRTRLVLVAVGRIDGERLVSDTTVGGQPTPLEGVRAPGRYLFLRSAGPLGFAAGVVRSASGGVPQPCAGAIVSAQSFDVVSLSGAGGGYLAAAPAGAATLTALDAARGDTGTAATFLTANMVLAVPLLIEPQVPRVVSVSPADGATNVGLTDPVVVTFSKAIDPATVGGANAANILLAGPGNTPVASTGALSNGKTVFTLRPVAALAANTVYTLTVSAAVKDSAGYNLAATVATSFGTLDTMPPPVPPAGAVSASVPDAGGQTTIRASQGTVSRTDTVYVVNLRDRTTRLVPQALYQANGSFQFQVPATITDTLRLRIVDLAGNETLVDLGRFEQANQDGSVSAVVGGSGGVVEGAGGVQVDVREDSFPDGAVVTVKQLLPAEIPIQLTAEDQERFAVRGGMRVDFGGATPARYVNLSMPPSAGDTASDLWLVGRLVTVDGVQTLSIVDTAKLIDGRITTSSPPFPGISNSGTYVVVKSSGPMGVNHGYVVPAPTNSVAMHFALMTMNPSMLNVLSQMPFIVGTDSPAVMGFAMPAGRVTMTENTVRLQIEPTIVAPIFREFQVQDLASSRTQRFPIVPLDYRVQVPGNVSDGFEVTVEGPGGTRTVASPRLTSGTPGVVTVRLNADKLEAPVTAVSVKNLATSAVRTFAFALPTITAGVTGDRSTKRAVWLVDVDGKLHALAQSEFAVSDSPYGAGNLVLRVAEGALDAVMRGGVKSAHLLGRKGTDIVVPTPPAPGLPSPAFAYAFDGDARDDYALRVEYNNGTEHFLPVPRFQMTVSSSAGDVIRTISGFVPPPDEPVDLGTITDDSITPYVVVGPSRTGSFDPAGTLTLTFSEPMNAESLKQFITLLGPDGRPVAGTVHVSAGNRVATFVPDAALKLGAAYTLRIQGAAPVTPEDLAGGLSVYAVRDGAGNPVASMEIKVTTYTPRIVGSLAGAAPFKDVAVRRKTIDGKLATTLFVTTGGTSDNLLAVDVTMPSRPAVVGRASAAISQQRVTLLPDVSLADRNGGTFTGDLAVSAHFNVNFSSMVFFDVTTRTEPRLLSSKVLTVNPDLIGGPNTGNTVFANGYAKGVAAFQTTSGAAAYAAVERMGVMAADVGQNVPQRDIGERLREPVFSGQFTDVVAYQSSLVAIAAQAGLNFHVLDPNLAPVGSTGLSYVPRRARVTGGLQADLDGDGTIGPNEVLTLAVVGGDFGISIVDLRDVTAPAEIGRIPVKGVVRDVEVDPSTRRILAFADMSEGGPMLLAVDLSHPNQVSAIDADLDGYDDRILWHQGYAAGANGLRLDRDRGLLYVANPSGLDIWTVIDSCCDLGVDTWAPVDTEPTGRADGLFKRELSAIKKGIIAGLDRAADKCPGFQVSAMKMLESGSSACLWSAEPEKTCGSNYQPGVSDHDISVFMPDNWYSLSVPNPSKTSDPHDGRPASILLASCVVDSLSFQFTDFDDPDRRPKEIDGFKFHDITFLPNYTVDFQSARYRLARTNPGEGDADNDLGLGRQLLVMKHLTEAYGVKLGEGDAGYRAGSGYEAVGWTDAEFNAAFKRYREVTKIALVEGHEWANLMEFLFVKGKGLIRIAGSENETSSFHDLFMYQLHAAGKAGIRTALARMAANPAARDALVLKIKRDESDTDPGLFTLRGSGADGCLAYERTPEGALKDPSTFSKSRACGSMEDFAASMAVRTLTALPPESRPFTPDEVKLIVRFYLVKSDEEQITSAVKADQFVNDVYRFIQASKAATADYWQRYVNGGEPSIPRETLDQTPDPDGADRLASRQANMARKDARLGEVGKVKLHVTPHVFNQGYRDTGAVSLAMFVRAPGESEFAPYCATDEHGTAACGLTLFLEGGDHQYPGVLTRDDGSFQRENDTGHEIPAFLLKVDQATTPPGRLGAVAFTLDLPGKTMKESNRQNNVGGFYYYRLDTSNPTVAMPYVPPALPVPPSVASAMAGDTECSELPSLLVDQTLVVPMFGIGDTEFESPAGIYLGERVELKLTVRNVSSLPANGVTVCTTLTNECRYIGTVVANASATALVPFSSLRPMVAQSIPTVYSYETGLQTGSPFTISVAWTGFQLVRLEPDPNPEQSTVMVGGTAYRHFGVVNTRGGRPAPDAKVVVEVTGAVTQTLTFTTNNNGVVGTRPTAETFDPGIAVRVPSGTALEGDPPAATVTVTVKSVNDVAYEAGAEPSYTIAVSEFRYQEQFRSGLAAAFSGKLFGGELGVGAGNSLSATFDQVTATPVEGGTCTAQAVTVGRQNGVLANFGWEPSVGGASATVPFLGTASLESPKATARIGASVDTKDAFKFPWPLDGDGWSKLSALALNTAISSTSVSAIPKVVTYARLFHDQLGQKWLDEPAVKAALGQVGLDAGFYESYRLSTGFNVAARVDLGLTVLNIGLGKMKGMQVDGQTVLNKDTSVRYAGLSAEGSVAATLGFGAEQQPQDQQVALSSALAFTAEAKAGFKWDFLDSLLNDPFKKIQKKIDDDTETPYFTKLLKGKALEYAKGKIFTALNLDAKISPEDLQRKKSIEGDFELAIVLNTANQLKPKRIDFTVRGAKPFGRGTEVPSGSRYTLTYRLNLDPLMAAVDPVMADVYRNLEAVSVMLGPDARAVVSGTPPGDVVSTTVGPSKVVESFLDFVRLILAKGEYEESVEIGQNADLAFGLSAELVGEGLGGSVSLNGYRSKSFAVEKGVLVAGTSAKLESYGGVTPPWGIDSFLTSLRASIGARQTAALGFLKEEARKIVEGVVRKVWTGNATVTMTDSPDVASANMITYEMTAAPGPLASVPMAPSDLGIALGKPHYGVGGFYTLTPVTTVLSQPAQLVIAYSDSDVAGLDEASLGLYRWNHDKGDWDRMTTAVVDTAANTVTASITAFGTYALAPPMPAGSIAWALSLVEDAGTTEAPVTRVTLLSDPLTRNDGTVVPAGTVVHIVGTTPDGVFLTPDARPEMDGFQVVTDASGRLHLQVQLIGRPDATTIEAFSEHGTIAGRAVVLIQR